MLATWRVEFFLKLLLLSLLIGTITCFLEGPWVIIWIHGLGFGLSLTMLLTWLIFFALRAGNTSLILRTSKVLADGLVAYVYDLAGLLFPIGFLVLTESFLLWKYLEMTLTSLFDLTGRGGSRGTLSIVTSIDFSISLLFLLVVGVILGENLEAIFALSVIVLLSV